MTTTATPSEAPMTTTQPLTGERADLLDTLTKHRFFLRNTLRGLTDEQAGATPTASGLCLGGLIRHVADGERHWVDFILEGPSAMRSHGKDWANWSEDDFAEYNRSFLMREDETVAGLLADYEDVARRTDALVATLDLDASHPLPEAPWFEPGARWSARRALLHIVAETAQHAGHADIIRETIDGAKSMG
jgi:uncharacterized damage-inducible protein DinB